MQYQYSAKLLAERNSVYSYVVSVSENNEDGETWEVDYSVLLKDSGGCKILSVKKVATR